jgi:hypothetical protein
VLNLTDGASSSADGFPAGSLPLGVAVCLSEHGQLSSEMQQQIPSDPSLTFLYSRMNPAVMSQLEAEHQLRVGGPSAGTVLRSPSPVMTEEDAFRWFMAKIDSGKSCLPGCEIHPSDHYHCRSDGYTLAFK